MNRKTVKAFRSFGFFISTMVIYLGVTLLGWGIDDLSGFFSLNQRFGYAVLVIVLGLAVGYQAFDNPEGIRGSRGEESKLVKRQSIVRLVIVLLLFSALFFLPYADRRGIGVMNDVQIVRWIGLFCFGLGSVLVFWSGITLGRLYSAEVTLQKNHQLITSGLYRYIRHPRYLGGIIYTIGISFLFRSWIGIAGIILSLSVIFLRIRNEEALMHEEFGQEWELYCKGSWRLIPFIY
jgi:protein-S-isoprenylcysteine O-methyltransferase Ste14